MSSPTTSTTSSLPVLSLDPFFTKSSTVAEKHAAAKALNSACQSHGFFYLQLPSSTCNTRISKPLLSDVLSTTKKFFLSATPEQKSSIARKELADGGDGARGYQQLGENLTKGQRDWHEAIDYYRPVEIPKPGVLLQGVNRFPDPQFEGVMQEYWDACLKIGEAMMVAFAWALGYDTPDEEDIFLQKTKNSFWVSRCIGYPPLPKSSSTSNSSVDAVSTSCGEHSDYGNATLLLTDSTPGALQVRSKDDTWITADPLPDTFVVNIGDMMEVWSNGLWKSTKHRVIHGNSETYRVSVPFFYEPDWNARVAPLEKCVMATGGEKRYEECVYGEVLSGKVGGNFYKEG